MTYGQVNIQLMIEHRKVNELINSYFSAENSNQIINDLQKYQGVFGVHVALEFYLSLFFLSLGHTLHDIFVLREGKFKRIPDLVVWPGMYVVLHFEVHYGNIP